MSGNRVYDVKPKTPDYVPVIALLRPEEKDIFQIKSAGFFDCVYRSTVEQIRQDAAEGRTGNILISLHLDISEADLKLIQDISDSFPAVRLIGFIYDVKYINDVVISNMMNLGNCGMEEVVKAKSPEDWFRLRSLLSKSSNEHIRVIAMKIILKDLEGAPQDCLEFFSVLFERNYYISKITHLCKHLKVRSGTLNTRFRRLKLPSPKDYLMYSRLIRMASLLEQKGTFASTAAIRLGYSSAQMFQRHLKEQMGMGSNRFRELYNGDKMLDYFRKKFIIPYVDVLKEFRPLKP